MVISKSVQLEKAIEESNLDFGVPTTRELRRLRHIEIRLLESLLFKGYGAITKSEKRYHTYLNLVVKLRNLKSKGWTKHVVY